MTFFQASRAALFCFSAAVGAPLALAQGGLSDPRADAAQCLERAALPATAEAAFEDALALKSRGGGAGAERCAATALIMLGSPEEGALRLERLATASDAGTLEARAAMLGTAGHAWLLAGRAQEALVAFSEALRIAPDAPGAPQLARDRAGAYALLGRWGDALTDAETALVANPDDGEALAIKARSLLGLERLEEAHAAMERARVLAPENIELLVLRGDIREALRLAGRSRDPEG